MMGGEKAKDFKGTIGKLFRYIGKYKAAVVVVAIFAIGSTVFNVVCPKVLGKATTALSEGIMNKITGNGGIDFTYIGKILLFCLGLYVLSVAFSFVQGFIMTGITQKVCYRLRKEISEKINRMPMKYFESRTYGEVLSRVTNDVEALNEMYSGILVRLFRNIVKIIGLAVVMIALDRGLALVSFVLLPIVMVLTVVFRIISRKTYRIVRTKLTDINTFLSENISGMRVIQIFGREERKFEEFKDKDYKLYRAHYREMMVFAIFRPLIYILSVLSLMIVLGIGSNEVLDGAISIGTLYIFSQYIQQFFDPIQELAEQFSTLQSSIASAEKIFTILAEEPQVKEDENPVVLPKVLGRIEFDHVWFAYDGEHYVLRDVSFVIEPGEKVAFVGATGAGKSSILNLIGRYYDIQKGHIYIDGVDIRKLSKKQLRSAIGQMQQDVFIFEGDIESNIRLHDDIPFEDVRAAAEYVNASHFIEKLPQKYKEPVTERGATFSAGERQLLSFARTLAHKPAILVMDEATANIDTETEILIQEALEKLMKGRTTIMVAHRLSTIQHADCIMVMHKGKIRERGTHQELLAQNGIYKKLYELQIHHVISS